MQANIRYAHTAIHGFAHIVDRQRRNRNRVQGFHFNARFADRADLDPSKAPAPPVSHFGQEFNYVIEGVVKVTVGGREYILEAWDSIYFNALLPHGQSAVQVPAQFITIIQE